MVSPVTRDSQQAKFEEKCLVQNHLHKQEAILKDLQKVIEEEMSVFQETSCCVGSSAALP